MNNDFVLTDAGYSVAISDLILTDANDIVLCTIETVFRGFVKASKDFVKLMFEENAVTLQSKN